MKRCSKIMSFCLAMILTVNFIPLPIVQAANIENSNNNFTIAQNDLGEYNSVSSGEGMKVSLTSYDDIFKSQDNKYFMKVEDNVFISTNRVDINLYDKNSIEFLFSQYDLSEEVKNEIIKRSDDAIEMGNTNIMSTLFTSAPSTSQTLMASPMSTTYFSYNGHRMKSDKLYTYQVSTGWQIISSGEACYQTARSISDFTMFIGSFLTKIVSIVDAGKSVLDFFLDEWGSTYITGSKSDYFQMRLIYDDVMQWTYAQIGTDWILGLVTQKVTITQCGTEQYYFDLNTRTGRTTTIDKPIYVLFEAPSFASPWAKAWTYLNYPETEYINWRVRDKVFMFH